tara:strand:+ start:423 stop:566 length:144 start_codon:yes stop_codon:yes gene_type:complete
MAKTQRIFELQLRCQSSSGVPSSVFCPFSAKKEKGSVPGCLVLALQE